MNQTVLNRAIEKLTEEKNEAKLYKSPPYEAGRIDACQSCIDLLTSLLPEYQKELEGIWDLASASAYQAVIPQPSCDFNHAQHKADKQTYFKDTLNIEL